MKPKKKKIRLMILIIVCILILPGLDQRMRIQYYELEVEQITSPIRIVLITDLHSCWYGSGQENLLDAIDEQNPDIIALAGDIFDDQLADTNTEIVIAAISEAYPCYYVNGNHECWCSQEKFTSNMQFLKDHNVHLLSGTMETVEIHGQTINICGVDDPDGYAFSNNGTTEQQLHALDTLTQNGNYSILLSHRPELFTEYENLHFDLVLCGHAHGGQWRIPGILNGLYAPNQGLFPQFAGGKYQAGQVTMLVSRGLARESTKIPRFYNRPELVVIDLQ